MPPAPDPPGSDDDVDLYDDVQGAMDGGGRAHANASSRPTPARRTPAPPSSPPVADLDNLAARTAPGRSQPGSAPSLAGAPAAALAPAPEPGAPPTAPGPPAAAGPRAPPPAPAPRPGCGVYVGGLQWWTTDAELEAAAGEFGPLASPPAVAADPASGKSKGYALLEFADSAAAAAAVRGLSGREFGGRRCVAALASGGGAPAGASFTPPPGTGVRPAPQAGPPPVPGPSPAAAIAAAAATMAAMRPPAAPWLVAPRPLAWPRPPFGLPPGFPPGMPPPGMLPGMGPGVPPGPGGGLAQGFKRPRGF